MYQQQSQPEAVLPHERVRPGCVISSIVGLILFWLYFTIIGIFNGNIWSWWLMTVMCMVLIGLLIMWLVYVERRQREVQSAWYTWQQQRQAFAAYQDQQMQRYYASLEEQQRRQEEQQRQAYEAYQRREWQRNYAYQEEQRRRQEEQQRKERLAMVKTLGDLLVLTASEFEHRVADLFVLVGYSDVQTTGGSGDLMSDIICTSPAGEKVVVQCKRYLRDHNVSSPVIQKFAGMVYAYHKADKGIFITTSSFTGPAIELGKTLHIELIDGEKLCQLFLKAGQVSAT